MLLSNKTEFFQISRKDSSFNIQLEFFIKIIFNNYRLVVLIDKVDITTFKNIGSFIGENDKYIIISLDSLNDIKEIINIRLNDSIKNIRLLGVKESDKLSKENFYSFILNTKFYQWNKLLKSNLAINYIVLYYYSEGFSDFEILLIQNNLYSKYKLEEDNFTNNI